MGKAPLYPHVPKKKEPQFPYRGAETPATKPPRLQSAEVDRDKLCSWITKQQRATIDKLIEGTEYDGDERGFAACMSGDGTLHLRLTEPLKLLGAMGIPMGSCPSQETLVGSLHTHPSGAYADQFAPYDFAAALRHGLRVDCIAYRSRGHNCVKCYKIYSESVGSAISLYNIYPVKYVITAQHPVLDALARALQLYEAAVESESDYKFALRLKELLSATREFERVALTHGVIVPCEGG